MIHLIIQHLLYNLLVLQLNSLIMDTVIFVTLVNLFFSHMSVLFHLFIWIIFSPYISLSTLKALLLKSKTLKYPNYYVLRVVLYIFLNGMYILGMAQKIWLKVGEGGHPTSRIRCM